MAQSIEVLSEKMQEMNLTNEIFYGEDLSSEEKFLKSLTEVVIKHFDEQYQEASYFFRKKSMAFCFESSLLSQDGVKKLLEVIDENLIEYFFNFGLSKIGCCSNYRMDIRIVRYPIEKSPGMGFVKRTQIIEFYWFNHSPVRHNEHKRLYESFVCKCIHCIIFSPNKK